jgi:hypothetical protein
MDDVTDIAGIAALLADGSRSTMLQALMDQRARTAGGCPFICVGGVFG